MCFKLDIVNSQEGLFKFLLFIAWQGYLLNASHIQNITLLFSHKAVFC
jgi:hypothetical protein